MSMPEFPPHDPYLTRDQALNMLLSSIAMEELALSNIMNAESEKIKYILGKESQTCPQEVIEVNNSVTSLLETVAQLQMLLKNKMEKVLDKIPSPPPPPKPCPPPPPDPKPPPSPTPPVCCQWAVCGEFQSRCFRWIPNNRLVFESGCGCSAFLASCNPSAIVLLPGKQYSLGFSATLEWNTKTDICIGFEAENQQIGFYPNSFSSPAGCVITGGGVVSTVACTQPVKVSLILLSKDSIKIQRSILRVIEL
ncbi:hypothetical protein [Clostridium minihomine]|uniref:hypothetical protein n=1 Tax=Clostridium minihomine TaxID=2045012 RepID=UPI00101AEC25|nr:hypothetical protein [Clostridium minihomine]